MIVDIAWLSKSLEACLEDDTEPRFVFFLDGKNSSKLWKLNLFSKKLTMIELILRQSS